MDDMSLLFQGVDGVVVEVRGGESKTSRVVNAAILATAAGLFIKGGVHPEMWV